MNIYLFLAHFQFSFVLTTLERSVWFIAKDSSERSSCEKRTHECFELKPRIFLQKEKKKSPFPSHKMFLPRLFTTAVIALVILNTVQSSMASSVGTSASREVLSPQLAYLRGGCRCARGAAQQESLKLNKTGFEKHHSSLGTAAANRVDSEFNAPIDCIQWICPATFSFMNSQATTNSQWSVSL